MNDSFWIVAIVVVVVLVIIFVLNKSNNPTGVGSGNCICPYTVIGTASTVLSGEVAPPNVVPPANFKGSITLSYVSNSSGNKYILIDSFQMSGLTSPILTLLFQPYPYENVPVAAITFPSASTGSSFSTEGLILAPASSIQPSNDPVPLIMRAFDQGQNVMVQVLTQQRQVAAGVLTLRK